MGRNPRLIVEAGMAIHHERTGDGPPLLLIHGLGGRISSWTPVLKRLRERRTLILFDLPGHGRSPAEEDSGTFAGLARSVRRFVDEQGLGEVDVAGESLGGRLVLELARQGHGGRCVALDPGGFWEGWERTFFATTISASVQLLRLLKAQIPALAGNAVSRTALLAQLSARPWALDGGTVAEELTSYASTATFDALVRDLSTGPMQTGPAAAQSGEVVIGWGRHDRLCLPGQAARAQAAFPSARMVWFEHSGHFPIWDEPDKVVRVILGED
ncbi:alpha/beta fold hydrolase [Sphingomonas sp. BN140010]|uniref:Alpha/beta fold hydrolase n=1 Tax=Sphingomonas arvum TaxID=2992113 RepID=A0ABT3JBD6_9SPHN|nr:alpha/beta fold hydrolase [Sphingomonas sp. BN140010]MCW3796349.1 alpha/beta fold hydrolase [Sphingomonas sp. BN140010]